MFSCSLKVALLNQCAPTASCYIRDNRPICLCDYDKATGHPTTGNPYIGCVWDLSGVWTFSHLISLDGAPLTLELQSTMHVLETGFMTGLEFAVVGGNLSVLVQSVYVDIYRPMNLIFMENEGFIDNGMRSLVVSSKRHFQTMKKVIGLGGKRDLKSLTGVWKDQSNIRAHMVKAKKPLLDVRKTLVNQPLNDHYHSYWFELVRDWFDVTKLNRWLFLDDTSYEEAVKYATTARYFQYGFRGLLDVGGKAVSIVSPADGLASGALYKILDKTYHPLGGPATELLLLASNPTITPRGSSVVTGSSREMEPSEESSIHTPYAHKIGQPVNPCHSSASSCAMALHPKAAEWMKSLSAVLEQGEPKMEIAQELSDHSEMTFQEALTHLELMEQADLGLSLSLNANDDFDQDYTNSLIDAPPSSLLSNGRSNLRRLAIAPGLLPATAGSMADHIMSTAEGGNWFGLRTFLQVPKQILFGYTATIQTVFLNLSIERLNLAWKRANFLLTVKYPILYSFATGGLSI